MLNNIKLQFVKLIMSHTNLYDSNKKDEGIIDIGWRAAILLVFSIVSLSLVNDLNTLGNYLIQLSERKCTGFLISVNTSIDRLTVTMGPM